MERYLPLGILFIIWIQSFLVNGACPFAECDCLDGTLPSNERTIDCRDKHLLAVPAIIATDEIFKELTFSSLNPSCREDPNSQCSNRIVHIQNNAFAGLKVRKIDFSTNYLASVENGAFNGLETVLTELLLEGDDINPVPFASLVNLTNLVTIELERFKQTSLETLPQEFPNLETLVLHTLQLRYISPNAVSGKLRKLRRLEIKDNPDFTSFPLSAIRLLTTLEHLGFIQNNLQILQSAGDAYISHTKLTELDLSHNILDTLQPGCFNHIQDRLEYLGLHLNFLDGSKLSTLSTGNWPKLEQLILDSNPLATGIPNNLFKNMPNLGNLNLQQTHLTHIERTDFEGLTNLHYLHLTGNEITQIDGGTFINTPNLQQLYLDSVGKPTQKLNFSADTARGLENLALIDLIESHIEASDFWKSLSVMTKLKHLTLSKNGLSNIPDLTFQYNTNLDYLDIKNNGLTELTQAQIHGLGSLKTLGLNGNSISVINKCVMEELPLLQNMYLSGNPLTCDCKLHELYDWAKKQQAADTTGTFPYILQAKCSSPISLQNQNLLDLTRNQLVCSDNTPVQCQTFTTSTPSTTTTTTPSTTTLPLPTITNFIIVGRNENGAQLSWNVQNVAQIDKYLISKQKLGVGGSPVESPVDKGSRQYFLFLEDRYADYSICIKLNTTDGRTIIPICETSLAKQVSTLPPPTISPPAGLTEGEIAGIATGSAILILLFVAIIIFLLRYQTKPKYKDTPPVHFTAVSRPTVGYDSKRFSRPKKSPQANGDVIISAISSGKTVPPSSPDSRHSAGSYQYLNENQMINIQPHLNYTKGANGRSHGTNPPGYYNNPKQVVNGYLKDPNLKQSDVDIQGYLKDPKLKPDINAHEKSSKSSYDKIPEGHHTGMAPRQPHQYINDPQKGQNSVYTDDIKDRPLPKPRTKHYENNNSSGFLNHGFDLDSPDHTYHEINPESQI